MTPKDFVMKLSAAVIDENVSIYQELFTGASIEETTDTYWKDALALYNALPTEQQAVLFNILRQVAVDTTSNILGVIDGVNILDGTSELFTLTYGDESLPLNGDLQSLLLSQEKQ